MDSLVTAPAASVGELVGHRLSENDRWNLALVQRDEVWDQVRMRHLLDSLLSDYPIGAILLCRVKSSSAVIRVDGAERHQEEASPDAWQLLDGQQRINALFSMLTDQGTYGRFYLDMTAQRQPQGPVQSRSTKDRALPYIVHRESPDEPIDDRDRYLDLSRWAAWAMSQDDLTALSVSSSSVVATLQQLDSEFASNLPDDAAEVAADRLMQLIRVWTVKAIPVLRAEVASPLDVLEIFTRINLGGVNVVGTDVYFAGVKTFWGGIGVDAEQRLDQVCEVAPFLGSRLHALRFISRLASRGLGRGDLLPLTVDRLAGDRGDLLLAAMRELTEGDAPAMLRLAAFCEWYVEHSELGYALHQVTQELWDDVLAWADSSPRQDPEWYARNGPRIDAYLLGATIFDYRSVMGTPFHHLALTESLDAGSKGSLFPSEQIIAVARAKTQLRGSRGRRVLEVKSADDRGRLAGRNGWLLTALAQRIPFSAQQGKDFDWDHIFPKGQASRMWAPGNGRRRHHPHRHLVNSTGNFWALNSSANRSLGMAVGQSKFDMLRGWASDPNGRFKVWPGERWSITEHEIASFIEVDILLGHDAGSVDRGMTLFKRTISGRAERLFDEALDRFPFIRLFASDSEVLGEDAAASHVDFRASLGISARDRDLRRAGASDARTLLNARADKLSAAIAALLESDENLRSHWIWRPRGKSKMGSWVAFELTDRNCIELILGWTESGGATLRVKAYPAKSNPSNLYPDHDHLPLGLDWDSTDTELVEEFHRQVGELQRAHPRV